jgi:hypothetical protein
MVRYFPQSWLLNCPYKSVNLAEYIINPDNGVYIQDIRYDRNLFDYNQDKFTRKVNLSLLDEKTDTPRDWEHFLSSASKVDRLILWDDRKKSENKIYSGYLQATRQAYIWHLEQAHVSCQLYWQK